MLIRNNQWKEKRHEAAVQKFGFVARSGAGKTYAAGVLVEELAASRAQVVVLDPVGTWWGLRVGADGKSPGLPIPVFGGLHADVPLEPEAGKMLADLVVSKRISAVVDVSMMRKGKRKHFITDFIEQLFQLKKASPGPIHIVIEEAHVFIPQRVDRGGERMLGAFEDLCRLGRNFGIGWSVISQRPQAVNKDVLNQVECLFALQTNGAHERKALGEWCKERDTDVKFVEDLPGLEIGEAYVWSPQWLRIFKRVKLGKKNTYDASSTPTWEKGKTAPANSMTQIDVDEISKAMGEVVQTAKDNDPKEFKKKLAKLTDEVSRLTKENQRLRDMPATPAYPDLRPKMGRVNNKLTELGLMVDELREEVLYKSYVGTDSIQPTRAHVQPATPRVPRPSNGEVKIQGGARRMLNAVAAVGTINRTQMATMAGLSPRSGTFGTYLAKLRTAGFVKESGGKFELTDDGRDASDATPLDFAELRSEWKGKLKGGANRMFNALLESWPSGLTRIELAHSAGLSASSGTYGTYLSKLRGNCLVQEEDGQICASNALFEK